MFSIILFAVDWSPTSKNSLKNSFTPDQFEEIKRKQHEASSFHIQNMQREPLHLANNLKPDEAFDVKILLRSVLAEEEQPRRKRGCRAGRRVKEERARALEMAKAQEMAKTIGVHKEYNLIERLYSELEKNKIDSYGRTHIELRGLNIYEKLTHHETVRAFNFFNLYKKIWITNKEDRANLFYLLSQGFKNFVLEPGHHGNVLIEFLNISLPFFKYEQKGHDFRSGLDLVLERLAITTLEDTKDLIQLKILIMRMQNDLKVSIKPFLNSLQEILRRY